jgi:hypothetical protein
VSTPDPNGAAGTNPDVRGSSADHTSATGAGNGVSAQGSQHGTPSASLLGQALDSVPSDTFAHTVLQDLSSTDPGADRGAQVATSASDASADHNLAGQETPATASQAAAGLAHKP